jgi:hypothetical protein
MRFICTSNLSLCLFPSLSFGFDFKSLIFASAHRSMRSKLQIFQILVELCSIRVFNYVLCNLDYVQLNDWMRE